jgi:trimethylamine--corrinoid protein Co-methyltransferase
MAYGISHGISFRILSKSDLERIHDATLHILEEVGVQVNSDSCRNLLKDSGCDVDERSRIAKIPSHLVKEALTKKSTSITLAARNPRYDAPQDLEHSYMTASGNGAVTVDFDTLERRGSTKNDVAVSSRIIDYLDNVHIHWPMVTSTDKNPRAAHLHDLDASLNNTEKHVMFETGVTESEAVYLSKMSYIAAGGEKEFRKRPITSALQCTFAPLQHEAGVTDAGIVFARFGLPVVWFCMPQLGATGPATVAGSIVVGNAEVLSALVMTQLAVPGAAVIYGLGIAPLDMKTLVRAGGSPEHSICSAIGTELAHHYRMPSCVGVSSTAQSPGAQACIETFTGVSAPLLAGADSMCGIGLLEDGTCLHLEEIVVENEIVALLARLCKGEAVNDDTLALDVIEKVGVGRNFLAQDHTLRHAKSDLFMPSLIDRRSYDAWLQMGSKSMLDRAREKVKWILKNHEVPPLDKDVQDALAATIRDAEKPDHG